MSEPLASGTPPPGRRWILPLVLIGAVLVLVPLSAIAALPGEQTVKGWLGMGYTDGCGDTRDRGPAGAWRAEAPLAEARDELRAVGIGRSAYILGGAASRRGRLTTVRTFERYDLDSGRRTALAPLPVALNHAGAAAYRGDVYVVGGAGDDLNRATDRFWRYSPRERRWSELPPMPTRRTALAAAVVDGRLYALGGHDGGVSVAAAEAYDFRTRKWSRLTPLPQPSDHLSAAAHRGSLFVAGGRRDRRGVTGAFLTYDASGNRWTPLPDMPQPMSGSVLEEASGRLVASGAENPPEGYMSGATFAFDADERRWSTLPSMSRPRHGHAGVASDGRLFVFGGSRCPGKAVGITAVDSLAVSPR